MDWQLWFAIAGMVGVLIGVWFYVRAWVRKPSEHEQAYAELERVTREVADTIGRGLLPAFQRVADTIGKVSQAVFDKDARSDRGEL